jgi:antioxidant, ahpC/TSA family
MKRILPLIFFSLLFFSCRNSNGFFKMEGRLLHMNQGELYLYSPDGVIEGLDTIKVEAGRFAFQIPCEKEGTLVVVFPNFSTQPIFTEPGEEVNVKADASHLREIEVKGTEANELMSDFRKQVASVSPPEERKFAEQFVKDHPESIVSRYIVNRYFILNSTPDYKLALNLIKEMQTAQPDNWELERMKRQLRTMKNATVGLNLPQFTVKTLDGKTITGNELRRNHMVIINVWASWDYNSLEMQRTLNEAARKGYATVLGISIDASPKDVRRLLKADDIIFENVCDGQMLDGKLLQTLGLTTMPDNIVVKNGKITERRVTANTIRQRINTL